LVKNSSRTAATNHPAEHGIEFDVVMARLCCAYVFVPHCGTSTRQVGAASRIHSNAKIKAVLPPPFPAKRLSRISNKHALAIVFLVYEKGRISIFERLSLAPGFSRVKLVVTRIKPVSTGFPAHRKAVKTAARRFSTIITGLKPGANENFPPLLKN